MSDDEPITVYVVEDCFPYEGCRFKGVFSTREKAQAWCAEREDGEEYGIEEWILDHPDD